MARVGGVVHTCDRCFSGDVLAVTTHTLVIDGHRFVIDVCTEHDGLFQRNLSGWKRCGHEQTAGLGEPTAEQRTVGRQRVPAEPLVVLRTVEEVREEEPAAEPVAVPDVSGINPDVMLDWQFTRSASRTMEDLGITAADVWRVVQAPSKSAPGMNPGTKVWSGDGLDVVVNPSTRTVITAYRPRRKTA